MQQVKSFFTIALLLLLSSCSAIDKSRQWQPVDRDLSIDLLKENGRNLLKAPNLTQLQANMRELTVEPSNAPAVTVYKFDTDRLCGIGGCLHSIYLQKKRIGMVLLNGSAIIENDDRCLIFKQTNAQDLTVLKYCYANNRYVQQPLTKEQFSASQK
jgi:hypothetical protein